MSFQAELVHGSPRMVDHTPGADIAAGEVVVLTDGVRIAHRAIASGAKGALAAGGGVYDFAKPTGGGTAMTDGDTAYWDDTGKQAENDATGNKKLGLVVGAVGDSDTTVLVHHMPN